MDEELSNILNDLKTIFELEEIPLIEIENLTKKLKSEEVKEYLNYIIEGSKPEVALREAFFTGKKLIPKYLLKNTKVIPEAGLAYGWIDYKIKDDLERTILLELKSLFERGKDKLKQMPLKWEDHKSQIWRYMNQGEYRFVILSDLKKWLFFSSKDCVSLEKIHPFYEIDLFEIFKEFETHDSIWSLLERKESQVEREDLDKRFLKSLNKWVGLLAEVKYDYSEKKEMELIINLINKLIFIQTLEDFNAIRLNYLKDKWEDIKSDWLPKGKKEVLQHFFSYINEFFEEYYDTELFAANILDYIIDDDENYDNFYSKCEFVLGFKEWQNSSIGGESQGITQYNFTQIDEDVFGKAYETFLTEKRRERGVYYTPRYVVECIVLKSLEERLGNLSNKIESTIKNKDFNELSNLANIWINIKVLDPACGSGSFLIKVLRTIWKYYKQLEEQINNLQQNISKKNKLLSSDESDFYDKLTEIKKIFGFGDPKTLISKIILRHLYGNDADWRAINVTKVNIWLEGIKLDPKAFDFEQLSKEKHVLPDLEMNLISRDSLLGLSLESVIGELSKNHKDELEKLSKLRKKYIEKPIDPDIIHSKILDILNNIEKSLNDSLIEKLEDEGIEKQTINEWISKKTPIFWPLTFWFIFYDENGKVLSKDEKGFDYIIGNPPYYVEVREHKDDFRCYSQSPLVKDYYESKMDVFYFFIELGLDLLKEDGRLGFIVMQYWHTRSHGKKLRDKIVYESTIKNIVNFNEFKVFTEAPGQHNTILVLHKSISDNPQHEYDIDVIEVLNKDVPVQDVSTALLNGVFDGEYN